MKRYKWEAEDWAKFFATTPRMTLTDGQREFLRQMRPDPLPGRHVDHARVNGRLRALAQRALEHFQAVKQ